ncbi:hypothetical protein EAE91_14230 [Photorhabdus noenieputensis]|nr:hypothetical protein [Photorhabdus noenieputensis]
MLIIISENTFSEKLYIIMLDKYEIGIHINVETDIKIIEINTLREVFIFSLESGRDFTLYLI